MNLLRQERVAGFLMSAQKGDGCLGELLLREWPGHWLLLVDVVFKV